jgi:general secretion pathway protein G
LDNRKGYEKEEMDMKRNAHRRTSRRGFTIVELLVVMGILVLLAGLLVPRIIGVMGSSREDMAKTQIRSLEEALRRFHLNMDEFPTTEQGLGALVQRPQGEDDKTATRWDGPYFEKGELPTDPWENEYQYSYEADKDTFPRIWSLGKDGEDNTDDDICNWKKEGEQGEEGIDGELDRDLNDEGDRNPVNLPDEPAMD